MLGANILNYINMSGFLFRTENGVSMFMWLGHNVAADWVQKVFGVQSAAQIDIDKVNISFIC